MTVDAARLAVIRQELARLSAEVEAVRADDRAVPSPPPPRPPDGSERAGIVRALIRERRDRQNYLDADLLGEPAWDMLLDLYLADLERTSVSVSSLCIASGVPGTTALRWIKVLAERELIERHPDPFDRRRTFVRLAPAASERIQAFIDQSAAWRLGRHR